VQRREGPVKEELMKAWRTFDDARFAAFEAGKRAKKCGNTQRYLKAHPAPQVTVEQLLAEAYELGQRSRLSDAL
jgi:hypothetical protein